MRTFNTTNIPMTDRIKKLKEELYRKMPEIEVDRAVLITESYQQTEQLPTVKRRALAFEHILNNIPITIRDNELIVGSSTKAPRSCQVFPEFSYEWLESELDTIEFREADPFHISEENKAVLERFFLIGRTRQTAI